MKINTTYFLSLILLFCKFSYGKVNSLCKINSNSVFKLEICSSTSKIELISNSDNSFKISEKIKDFFFIKKLVIVLLENEMMAIYISEKENIESHSFNFSIPSKEIKKITGCEYNDLISLGILTEKYIYVLNLIDSFNRKKYSLLQIDYQIIYNIDGVKDFSIYTEKKYGLLNLMLLKSSSLQILESPPEYLDLMNITEINFKNLTNNSNFVIDESKINENIIISKSFLLQRIFIFYNDKLGNIQFIGNLTYQELNLEGELFELELIKSNITEFEEYELIIYDRLYNKQINVYDLVIFHNFLLLPLIKKSQTIYLNNLYSEKYGIIEFINGTKIFQLQKENTNEKLNIKINFFHSLCRNETNSSCINDNCDLNLSIFDCENILKDLITNNDTIIKVSKNSILGYEILLKENIDFIRSKNYCSIFKDCYNCSANPDCIYCEGNCERLLNSKCLIAKTMKLVDYQWKYDMCPRMTLCGNKEIFSESENSLHLNNNIDIAEKNSFCSWELITRSIYSDYIFYNFLVNFEKEFSNNFTKKPKISFCLYVDSSQPCYTWPINNIDFKSPFNLNYRLFFSHFRFSLYFPSQTVVQPDKMIIYFRRKEEMIVDLTVLLAEWVVLGMGSIICLFCCMWGCRRARYGFFYRDNIPLLRHLEREFGFENPEERLKRLLKEKNIAKIKFNLNIDSFRQEDCAFCLDKFKDNEDIAKLSCKHIFHFTCVEQWNIIEKRNLLKCPLCKEDFEKSTTDFENLN